jgi:hypothetical protein
VGGHARQLSGGSEEIRDVLLSGAVVSAAVCDMAKTPSFVHREPIFKLDWIRDLEKDAYPVTDKTRVAHELRACGY